MTARSALGEELYNVWKHQPLWAGDTLSGQTIRTLCQQHLVTKLDGYYVLTAKGRALIEQGECP